MALSLVSSRTARAGADRCPGTLTVHPAQDGGLARIRIPGGALPAPLLAALGEWSEALGNGRMELTGRGNLQLRGLAPGVEAELADRLDSAGLLPSPAHDRARNVLASPLSGRDRLGAWDVRPLVGALDRGLCGSPELAELPGRFLFALDDGRGDVAGLGADVTLLALPGERRQRAALLLGGMDTGLRPAAAGAVDLLLVVARAFLRERADDRVWRVAELPGGPLSLVPAVTGASSASGVAGALSVPRLPAVPGSFSGPERSGRGPVGRFAQVDGRVALGVGVPLGELTPERCRLLASCAADEVVLTPWRGVLLPDLDAAGAAEVTSRLADAGLLVDADAPLLTVTACTGRPGCGKALADVRADALASTPPGPPVHWSGCARRCGRPSGADVIDVVAEEGGYRVWRDGAPLDIALDASGLPESSPGDVPHVAHSAPKCATSDTSGFRGSTGSGAEAGSGDAGDTGCDADSSRAAGAAQSGGGR